MSYEALFEGVPVIKAIEHRDSCAFCKEQLAHKSEEGQWRAIRHIIRFFNGPKDFLESCSQ